MTNTVADAHGATATAAPPSRGNMAAPPPLPSPPPHPPPLLPPTASRLHGAVTPLLCSGSLATSIPSLEQQRSGEICGDPHASGEVHGEKKGSSSNSKFRWKKSHKKASGDLEKDPAGSIDMEEPTSSVARVELRAGSEVPKSRPSTKKKRKKDQVNISNPLFGDVNEEQPASGDVHEQQQPTSGVCHRPRNVTITHSQEISPTLRSKRPLSEASDSLRASKAAKVVNAKVNMKQLQNNSKNLGRKMSPIVSRSPILNMMARKRAQSYAKSPDSHARSPSLHELSPVVAPAHGSKRRPRKLTSIIWNDAEPIYIDGFLMQGRCKYCNIVLPASKVSGTSQLARHLKVCEVKCSMDGVIQQIRTSDEIDPNWKFDQEVARIELLKLIVLHGLPFSFVEYAGFRKFCASLNPWFKSVNRVTIQNDCMDTYHQLKKGYEDFFMTCNHRVSLTGDMWTSNQKLGYLCITCHWIDRKWRVRHRIIRFCLVESPHDAWNMLAVVLQSLDDWNIQDRIFSFTMDNAEVNTKMISHLRKILVDRNLIHHEGKFLHIRCAAHVLNLIVQDGLKAMKSVIDNIRESVKYVRSSQSRKEQFAKIVAQVGIKCKHQPTLDVPTRWNSTFLMLESALPFRKVFKTLDEQEPNYTFGPLAEEWKMVEDICQLLKVFYHATNVISGSNYPTSNLYFLEIWSVKLVLDDQANSNNATIRIMVREMQKKFHKYFMESYLSNCIPVILDPRFKIDHVEFRLKKYFGLDADKHIEEVKTAIDVLFTEYAAEFEYAAEYLQEINCEEVVLADSALSDWDEHVKLKKAKKRNELQRYLEEDFHPRTPDFDILKWWDVNSARYPVLGKIARDVLAVPASTVASESAFSTCGRVITDHRSSLAPETVEALMCFGDWIKSAGPSSEASTPDVVF